MLIKRLAIKNNIKFTRIDMRRIYGSVCAKCKYDGELSSFHNICGDVFHITGVNSYAISYAYYIPRT